MIDWYENMKDIIRQSKYMQQKAKKNALCCFCELPYFWTIYWIHFIDKTTTTELFFLLLLSLKYLQLFHFLIPIWIKLISSEAFLLYQFLVSILTEIPLKFNYKLISKNKNVGDNGYQWCNRCLWTVILI